MGYTEFGSPSLFLISLEYPLSYQQPPIKFYALIFSIPGSYRGFNDTSAG